MLHMPTEYLDYDFGVHEFDQELGCLPRTELAGDIPGSPVFEEAQRKLLIPEDEWEERVAAHVPMTDLPQMVKNQRQEGSCTSNASSQNYDSLFVRQFGAANHIETSPISLYREVAPNGRTGSTLPENLLQLRRVGILPSDTAKNREQCKRLGIPAKHFHPNTGYSVRPGKDWEETAHLFRCDEFFDITTFEGLMTALLNHFMVVYARQGHCILAVVPIFENGRFYIDYINSWGKWGRDGYGRDSRKVVTSGIRQYGMFGVRSVYVPEGMILVPQS